MTYKRTKIGQFMYDITIAGGRFLMKNIWLYWILQYTWGIIGTLAGWIGVLFLWCLPKKIVTEKGRFGLSFYAMFGNNWGGLELGHNFFIADKMGESWTFHTKQHEMGHSFQNALYGPFVIFLVWLPSAFRYWQQRIRSKKGLINKPYDAFWGEQSATDNGEYYYKTYIKE